jgi:hypothetical protein
MEKAESRQKTEISIQGLHSNKGENKDLNGLTTRNHSISTTKRTAQGLIQRYKARYSQKGITQIHSGRKRLVVRRYGWIQNIANPLLASALLPDMFCNKNNAISPEAIGGETTTVPPQKKLLIQLPPALYQDNQEGCDVRSKGGGLRENKCLCTYKDKSSTLIRRSSTLKRRTPLETHCYNCKD